MRLSDLYLQFRRQRSVAKIYTQEQQPAHSRQKMTLESMTRPAQTKSLKAVLRQH